MLLLWGAWIIQLGYVRGTLAVLARTAWLLPLFLALFPRIYYKQIASAVALKPVYVLIDDSDSMKVAKEGKKSYLAKAQNILDFIDKECAGLGCVTRPYYLSQIDDLTNKGYTPLFRAFSSWQYGLSAQPWVLMSDGGDYLPQVSYAGLLPGAPRAKGDEPTGLVVGFRVPEERNLWLKEDKTPIMAFAGKPFSLNVVVHRQLPQKIPETVQLQVVYDANVLATSNTSFAAGEDTLEVVMKVPPLAKGQYLLDVKVLPTAQERATWDNTIHRIVDVMPNTMGVLHLLGSPSWDGRFLRRYLKSEPKYDMISFFILRDPNDMQLTSERELSLIPFPRDRLFNEELPNFQGIVVQDFALYKFLLPSYQQNLVNYVKNGGSILFIGGSRALHAGDYENSDFAALLPFYPPTNKSRPAAFRDLMSDDQDNGYLSYDENLEYKIAFASPTLEQRLLANVYDDWKGMENALVNQKGLKGLHHLEGVVFKKEGYTPLLEAKLRDGRTLPLAAASYPGKGRAIWIFSDSLYRMALSPGPYSSRGVYHDFFQYAMNWLMRRESKKTLAISDVIINSEPARENEFIVKLRGPATRHLKSGGIWQLSICGMAVDLNHVVMEAGGQDNWQIKGRLDQKIAGGTKCTADIEVQHPVFGSVKASLTTIVPQMFTDAQIKEAPNKLIDLASQGPARLVWEDDAENFKGIRSWLQKVTENHALSVPAQYETVKDHFWAMDQWWFWLLLLGHPIEIMVRRWPLLVSSRTP